ncbi:MAG TPA: FAD binding domain-containing protein [Chloroflexia bacterium]|nr:FAD binding domain-containing protein [Chloroflexia bacterium]
MWQTYLQPATMQDALQLLRAHAGQARVVAGGTDLVVELERGIRPAATLIDISRLADLKYVRADAGQIRLGALATHNDVLAAPACVAGALPLAQACLEVGAPQIRTRGTVAGNVITGSPANDTISPLLALGAAVVLTRLDGERVVPLDSFYTGVRRTVIAPDELLREIRFPAIGPAGRGLFLKLGLRRAQAISVIHLAFVLTFDGDRVQTARIALGCLAPTVVRARQAEAFLAGQPLTPAVCAEAGRHAWADVRPIDDLRGSAAYRRTTLAALVAQGLARIAAGQQAAGFPAAPVLLDTGGPPPGPADFAGTITTTINGRPYQLPHAAGKTLLNALREDAGLTGTKEGCAEGECGACTVWLNGQAVMACLVPAPQAHQATITTIEGLAGPAGLHPLQQAFIDHGAVQCGFCIPGMIMAGAKLLAEHPHPDLAAAQVAISGNLCRCTGYRKILDAMREA